MRQIFVQLTDIVEELVAFVEHEHFEVLNRQGLLAGQVQDAAGGANNNVRGLVALQELNLLFNRLSAVNDFRAELVHELGESIELLLDLVRKLACVAQHKCAARSGAITDALEDSNHEDGGLAHTRDGLAENVNTKHCFGNASLLDVRRMLKTAVGDGLLQLWLEKHVLKAR